MQKRKMDELISYFNRKVADMDIKQTDKMELLGMITAIGIVAEKEYVEPEIIYCKNCTFCCEALHHGNSENELVCVRTYHYTEPDNFCSWAERKTDEVD